MYIYVLLQVGSEVSVFEINIRFVGGLLSLYALTKDEVDYLYHVIIIHYNDFALDFLHRFLKLKLFMLQINCYQHSIHPLEYLTL